MLWAISFVKAGTPDCGLVAETGRHHGNDSGSNLGGHRTLEIKLLAKFDVVLYAAFIPKKL
jgi:hypothetical protein